MASRRRTGFWMTEHGGVPTWGIAVGVALLLVFVIIALVGPSMRADSTPYVRPSDAFSEPTPVPSETPLPLDFGRLVLSDTFDRADAVKTVAAETGQAWSESGPGGLAISDGRLVAETPDGNGYLSTTLDGTPRALLADASWTGEGERTNGVTLITSTDANYSLQNMVHFNLSLDRWVLQLRTAGGEFENVMNGGLDLAADGTVYRIGLIIDGETATVLLPDGSTQSISDPRVAALNGPYVTYEITDRPGHIMSRIDALEGYVAP